MSAKGDCTNCEAAKFFIRVVEELRKIKAHKPAPTEEGTDGTSERLTVRAADGPLGTSPHSSPLPVSRTVCIDKSGNVVKCLHCGKVLGNHAQYREHFGLV